MQNEICGMSVFLYGNVLFTSMHNVFRGILINQNTFRHCKMCMILFWGDVMWFITARPWSFNANDFETVLRFKKTTLPRNCRQTNTLSAVKSIKILKANFYTCISTFGLRTKTVYEQVRLFFFLRLVSNEIHMRMN